MNRKHHVNLKISTRTLHNQGIIAIHMTSLNLLDNLQFLRKQECHIQFHWNIQKRKKNINSNQHSNFVQFSVGNYFFWGLQVKKAEKQELKKII